MSYWWKSEWADMLGEPHDLDHGDFDSMGVYPYCVALPFDSPTELKRRVWAAVISWKMGLASIDYPLKRYVEDKDEEKAQQLGQRKAVAEALLTATKYADKIINRIVDIPDKPGDLGLVFTTLTLMRSKSTLRACRILLKLGHGAESFVIARALLEQVAWIYAAHQAKTPEELESVTAPRAVRRLSKLMPLAGRLYGYLSDVAHINPRHARQYLHLSEGPMKVTISGAAGDKLLCAKILLHLVDIQTVVAEHVYADHLAILETVSKNLDGTLTIRADRPFVAEIEKHASQLGSFQ